MNDTLIYLLAGASAFLLARGGKGGAETTGGGMDIPDTEALRKRLCEVALAEAALNVRETGGYNSDTGGRIIMYQTSVHLRTGKGSMWCAAFVSWCVMTALGRTKIPKGFSASTSWLMVDARDAYLSGKLPAEYIAFANEPETLSRVKAGWGWVRGTTPDGSDPLKSVKGGWKAGHTGIVVNPVSDKAGHFETVEGNTCVGNQGPPCNGGGVFIADRPWQKEGNVVWYDPFALVYVLENPPKPSTKPNS